MISRPQDATKVFHKTAHHDTKLYGKSRYEAQGNLITSFCSLGPRNETTVRKESHCEQSVPAAADAQEEPVRWAGRLRPGARPER